GSKSPDAMAGYRGRYEHLGKAAARLDDVASFVPSRVSALALVAATPLARADTGRALRVALRDHALTESPTAGWPMSAAAGALGVRLAKRGPYAPGAAVRPAAADAGVGADRVLLTAGAPEGLRLAITAFVARGDRAIALGPTYGEFARLAGIRGASFTELRSAPPAFDPSVDALIGELERGGITAALLCDPNNPTGTVLNASDVRRILAAANVQTHVVVDQSFSAFVNERVAVAELVARPNVVLVRSLTKLLAAPGLRLGYVIAHPSAIASLRAVRD